MKKILETARLSLREFNLQDEQLIFDLNEDPEVIRYVSDPRCKDLAAAKAVLTDTILPQYKKYGHGRWAVELKETGEFIGWCGIKFLEDSRLHDLGYRFFRKHWRKGFASEAASAALAFGHGPLHLKRIIATADPANTGSIRVMEKIGMRYQGTGTVDHCENAVIYFSEKQK